MEQRRTREGAEKEQRRSREGQEKEQRRTREGTEKEQRRSRDGAEEEQKSRDGEKSVPSLSSNHSLPPCSFLLRTWCQFGFLVEEPKAAVRTQVRPFLSRCDSTEPTRVGAKMKGNKGSKGQNKRK